MIILLSKQLLIWPNAVVYQILEIIIYLSYKYKIGNHVWDSPLCKLPKCFDSYMSHSITVFPEGSFIRDLCLMRDDYTVFNNCAITKEELVFSINHLCTS